VRAALAAFKDAVVIVDPARYQRSADGKEHLFADSSLPSYDQAAANLLALRVLYASRC
jgi:hypothetical protein